MGLEMVKPWSATLGVWLYGGDNLIGMPSKRREWLGL